MGTLVVEQGTIADVLAVLLGQGSEAPTGRARNGLCATSGAGWQPVQSAYAPGAMSRTTTI